MSATSAKRPERNRGPNRGPSRKPRVKRAAPATPRQPRKPASETARETEGFDGPGYQFGGFRMMCRHRHIRH
jgi:hypothetical protein